MRFMLPLSDKLKTELWELSQHEQRTMKDQAIVLLNEALEARRRIPAPASSDAKVLVITVDEQEKLKGVCYA